MQKVLTKYIIKHTIFTRGDNVSSISNTTNINVRIDSNLKKESDILFKELGLNMTTAISMFLTKCVNTASIPFKVEKEKPNKELIEAIKEGDKILKDLKNGKRKGYNNVYEMFKELDKEIDDGNI